MYNKLRVIILGMIFFFFFQGCDDTTPLDEDKFRDALAPFAEEPDFNDIQRVLLFEYIKNGKTYLSHEELEKEYGHIRSVADENVIGIQSMYNDGRLSLYVNTEAIGGRVKINGIILNKNRLEELGRLIGANEEDKRKI